MKYGFLSRDYFVSGCAHRKTSFLFLILFQAITFTVKVKLDQPHGHEYITNTLNLDWSFGMCLSRDLNALNRLAWAYLAPVYLLFLVLLSLFLSRFYRFNRVFGRSACIRMFWHFILLSFSSLAATSFQLLKHTKLFTSGVDGFSSSEHFADDPSYKYFEGDHLPWAMIASVIVAMFCIPLPILLPFLRRYHLLIPFYDIYTGDYKFDRMWWSSFDLTRRILLAAVYTAEDDIQLQHLAMSLVCFCFLSAHTLAWSFKEKKANIIETVFLSALACITLLSSPNRSWKHSVAIECLFFVPVAALVVVLVREQTRKPQPDELVRLGLGLNPVDDGQQLRDLLLADHILEHRED